MPVLYLVIGPSGAGKTTYGHLLVPKNIDIFNSDKEILTLQAAGHNSEDISLILGNIYKEKVNTAIEHNEDFALETPFADNFGPDTMNLFKRHGYGIHGIFIGHSFVGELVDRVEIRKFRGGNVLSPGDVEYNFDHSFRQVNVFIMVNAFKHIDFYDTTDGECIKVAEYADSVLTEFRHTAWFREHICEKLKNSITLKLTRHS